jgi:acetyl esterase/lipase
LQTHLYLPGLRVEAEWVIADKDPKDSLERGTARGAAKTKEAHSRLGVATSSATSNESSQDEGRDTYRLEMDGAPCILYIHGGKNICQSSDGNDQLKIETTRWVLFRKRRWKTGHHDTICTNDSRPAFQ